MDDKNLLNKKNIHLIGVGGTGMSGLAKMLVLSGKEVSGSDKTYSPALEKLKKTGVKIFFPQEAKNIEAGKTEAVIFSHAIFPDNPEYEKAVEYKIPLLSYPEAVGCIMSGRRGIAIAGTHGKTTTAAMLTSLMIKGGASPSFLLGGEVKRLGNSGVGKSEFLIVEACEYRKSFLNYSPEIAIITNIEPDHLDYYRNLQEIKKAFREFVRGTRKKATVIYCGDDSNTSGVIERCKKPANDKTFISYGLKSGDWTAKQISMSGNFSTFKCSYKNTPEGTVRSRARGLHNIYNAMAAIACSRHAGISWNDIRDGLENFRGISRRCEIIGKKRGVTIIDDYGHHPTEIAATLECVRNMFENARIIVVFQPHQYSRTRFLLSEFARSFSAADKVVVPDIYFVRDSELEKKLVNAQILVEKIRHNGHEALYLPTFEEITEYLCEITRKGDVVLTVGAGPVDTVARGLIKRLSQPDKKERTASRKGPL